MSVYGGICNHWTGKSKMACCDSCANYAYDEDYECYVCDVDLDEDEMYRFLTGNDFNCPFYQNDDEYKVVRHQM